MACQFTALFYSKQHNRKSLRLTGHKVVNEQSFLDQISCSSIIIEYIFQPHIVFFKFSKSLLNKHLLKKYSIVDVRNKRLATYSSTYMTVSKTNSLIFWWIEGYH